MSEAQKRIYSWIGADHPEGWRRMGSVDVADPTEVDWALDRLYRVGSIYDGGSGSVAEPCCADIYKDIRERPSAPPHHATERVTG